MKKIKEERSEYVKHRVSQVKNVGTEVAKLSKELFLTKSTIYRDLKK